MSHPEAITKQEYMRQFSITLSVLTVILSTLPLQKSSAGYMLPIAITFARRFHLPAQGHRLFLLEPYTSVNSKSSKTPSP